MHKRNYKLLFSKLFFLVSWGLASRCILLYLSQINVYKNSLQAWAFSLQHLVGRELQGRPPRTFLRTRTQCWVLAWAHSVYQLPASHRVDLGESSLDISNLSALGSGSWLYLSCYEVAFKTFFWLIHKKNVMNMGKQKPQSCQLPLVPGKLYVQLVWSLNLQKCVRFN